MDKRTPKSSCGGIQVRTMRKADLPRVEQIERLSFSSPWTYPLFQMELENEERAYYLVIEQDGALVGYAGYWRIGIEGHVVTFAIHPDCRRQGLGKKLLEALINHCRSMDLERMTLEVRRSNTLAQGLYEQFGFEKVAIQPQYYHDNSEDAFIYWRLL